MVPQRMLSALDTCELHSYGTLMLWPPPCYGESVRMRLRGQKYERIIGKCEHLSDKASAQRVVGLSTDSQNYVHAAEKHV